ncbi:putative transcriptional regulator [Brevibacillus aydinogluensis]|nr:putative transcriptional regulator [Brevibacillus aydinogluensis]
MFGLGKNRTKFGKWLDEHGITIVEFAKESKVNRDTIGDLASKEGYSPRKDTINKILSAAKKRDPKVTYEKLFPPSM